MAPRILRAAFVVMFVASALFIEGGTTVAMHPQGDPDLRVQSSRGTRPDACWVSVTAASRVTQIAPQETVAITFDDQCRATTTRTRGAGGTSMSGGGRLAAPLASPFRGCRTRNIMWDDLGLAELERLQTIIEFTYTGSVVDSLGARSATSTTAGGSPYTTETPSLEISQWNTPEWYVRSQYVARYWWWWSYDAQKRTDLYGYYDGYCQGFFEHVGNVCRTCRLLFYTTAY